MRVIQSVLFLFLILPQLAQAMTCAQILDKAKKVGKGAKGKAACVLEEHNVGLIRGSSESVYLCKGIRYTLTIYEDLSCSVAKTPKK